ncbi:hypothetical protein LCGC14_1500840 [marine sediment metagenome]|uniref:Uncharacterized protein n=1 Tax=marine sediment metagenome TaxID=412755 RepID=A0A0F9J4M9_9ZZZZ
MRLKLGPLRIRTLTKSERQGGIIVKWWLISDDTIKKIKCDLEIAIAGYEPVALTRPKFMGEFPLSDALHELDSGLHKTEAIPEDML